MPSWKTTFSGSLTLYLCSVLGSSHFAVAFDLENREYFENGAFGSLVTCFDFVTGRNCYSEPEHLLLFLFLSAPPLSLVWA